MLRTVEAVLTSDAMAFPPPGYTRQLYKHVKLSELLVPVQWSTHPCHATKLAFGLDNHWELAALWVATHIVKIRTGGSPSFFDQWVDQLEGVASAPPRRPQALSAYLHDDIGSPATPPNPLLFRALLVVHVRHALVTELPSVAGTLVHVEEPSWSATDSGGDGLAIYRNTGDELVFRLWESKWHGTQDSARDTARKAANQIRLKATHYLARLSKVGERFDDPDLRDFCSRLVELWVNQDSRAGAGVAIAAQPAADRRDTFGVLAKHWAWFSPHQREGLLAVVQSLNDFAETTLRYIWKGL